MEEGGDWIMRDWEGASMQVISTHYKRAIAADLQVHYFTVCVGGKWKADDGKALRWKGGAYATSSLLRGSELRV